MYSSGKHDHLTADPTPWEVDDGGGYTAYGSRADALHDGFTEVRFEPDSEFDRPLTNPANPILKHYRERADRWPLQGYLDSLSAGNRWQWEELATEAQMEHALRVLTRLDAQQH